MTESNTPGVVGSPRRRPSRSTMIASGVGLVALGLSGVATGGFGAFASFASRSQVVNTGDATLNFANVTVTGDPGPTAFNEPVVNMIPGDYRERLFRLSAPTGQTLSTIQYAVSGNVDSDATLTTIPGVNQVGDAINALAATNASATAGEPGGNAVNGQGGLAVEVYTCAGTWTRANGVIGSRTDDIQYGCSAGGNGTLVGTFTDVPTTGSSAPFQIAASITDTGTEFMIRTRFVDDGTTNGRQNVMMTESITLTHLFTGSVRSAGAV